MFWHNFKYSLKALIRNKILIFWTFAFPIFLAIFFNLAFSDIEKNEKLSIINIAIIENDTFDNDPIFKETFKTLSDKNNEDRLFKITYTNTTNAIKLLEDKEITGYLSFDDNINITVNSNGVNETILKNVVDEISSNKEIINNLITKEIETSLKENTPINYEAITTKVTKMVTNNTINLSDITSANLSYTMIEYYTLIAMSALYGGILSMVVINYKLANMNNIGKRTSISPLKKGKMILGSLLASYIVQLCGLSLLFIFTTLILKVDYGSNLPAIIILSCCGSLAGLSLGVAIATLVKSNENTKTGILISITMLGCFLSGMMGITMKYIIDKNIPLINKINPASMITDGFYSLYYYHTPDRFIFNIISLLLFSTLMILISIQGLRRQKYDSI